MSDMRESPDLSDVDKNHPIWQLVLHSASGRFFWLLLALICFIIFDAVSHMMELNRILTVVPLLAVLTATGVAARHSRRRLLRSVLLSATLVATGGYATVAHSSNPIYICICLVLLLLCILDAISYALGYLLRGGAVGGDHIYAAICAYLLLIMFFASLYWILEFAIPHSFAVPADDPDGLVDWPDLLYFSFATFATVGYGDITARQPLVRAVCMLEMLTGTFYIAVVIARITGLYSRLNHSKPNH